jgi:soluble lytic murein transglycosylase-like protein
MADPLALYDPIIKAAAEEWNVDPRLLKAMMMQESGGKPGAVSSKNAQGLMQIIPETQKYLGITNPHDPVQSIFGAAKYMNEALEKEGNPEAALLYYHGGPNWRDAYGPESRGYVPAIAGHYKRLQAAEAPQQGQAAPAPQAAVNPDIDPGTGLVDPLGTLRPNDAGSGGQQ